jgi:hypothetical protein
VSELKFHPAASITLLSLGKEQQPLLVVDDMLLNPEVMLAWAAQGDNFVSDPTNLYPGVRKALPVDYAQLLTDFVQNQLLSVLNVKARVRVNQSVLAITNQDQASLLPIQRIPHFDSSDPKRWAMVHYLCDENFGGTGFFRHLSSGFESMTTDRQKKYQRLLEDDAVTIGLPEASYLQGGSSLFEEIYRVEAKFNRALFYPGNIFHSGLIKYWQSSQIGQCRLTANCLIDLQ